MKRGYLPNNLTEVPECELYMLPGLTAEFDAFRIAGVTVSRIDWEEFRLLENTQFAADLQDVFVYDRVPFYAVFSSFDADGSTLPVRSHSRAVAVQRLARSLWLLKEGTLHNPLYFIRYQRIGAQNTRDPRVYGRLAYALWDYELTRDDLSVVEGIYYALACFDDSRVCRELELAEHLFRETHQPGLLEPTETSLLLLGSLEALAGHSAAELIKAPWVTTEQRTLLEGFRQHRNGIAHGKRSAQGAQVVALREIVRSLLREALRWSLEEPGATTVVGDGLVNRLVGLAEAGPGRLANAEFTYPTLRPRSA